MQNWERPSIDRLRQQSTQAIYSRLPITENIRRNNLLEAIANMHAGALYELYGAVDFCLKQIMPSSAHGHYLDLHFSWYGFSRLQDQFASGSVDFTANRALVIPAFSTCRSQGGLRFHTQEALTLTEQANGSFSGSAPVLAEKTGPGYNLPEGNRFYLTDGIMGLETIENTKPITGGLAIESDDSFRYRCIQNIRERFSVYGKKGDYVHWALEAHDEVERAFEQKNIGNLGKLVIFPLKSFNENVSAECLKAIRENIRQYAPVGTIWSVSHPTLCPVDMIINIHPNEADLIEASYTSITTYFDRLHIGETIDNEAIEQMIKAIAGIETVKIEKPEQSIKHLYHQYPYLNKLQINDTNWDFES